MQTLLIINALRVLVPGGLGRLTVVAVLRQDGRAQDHRRRLSQTVGSAQ